ncbi:hypothetical protein, partial [Chitinivibrio alkaliphilus]|uniref:hypothetical protein n=1 Tax=Chitinivibrio alkaliphilus TaxID=1505232 RepID=UPI00055126F3
AIRDTVDGLRVDPESRDFTTVPLPVIASISGEWVNQEIWVSREDSPDFIAYSGPIDLFETEDITFEARADFAVWQRLDRSYRRVARVDSAAYFDATGDGRIDSVEVAFDLSLGEYPETLILQSPFSDETRTLSQEAFSGADGVVRARFEPFSFSGKTAFTAAELGEVRGTLYDDGTFLIADSLAPVLVSAEYSPGEIERIEPDIRRFPDTLRVVYSDEVSVENLSRPFAFHSDQGAPALEYATSELRVERDNSYDRTMGTFIVEEVVGSPIAEGDSVSIELESGTVGSSGTVQTVTENRRVPLIVHDIPYRLYISSNSPAIPTESEIPEALTSRNRSVSTGVVVVADFLMQMEEGGQDGRLTIFDKVGNVVQEVRGVDDSNEHLFVELHHEDRTRLVFYWTGKNRNGRSVAAGAYHGVL